MKQATFLQGAGFAIVTALAAGALFAALAPILGSATALRGLIAACGFAYLLFLLKLAPDRIGRITSVAVWGVSAAVLWWATPHLALYLLAHVGLIWLIRSVYFYSGLLPALADLMLSSLAVAGAIWAASRTGSFSLSVWSFFLVQSLFVFVPRAVAKRERAAIRAGTSEDSFARAHRSAQSALRRLAASD